MAEWWAWWSEDGRWARRGRARNDLVMARIGDTGSYSPSNVKCISAAQNAAETCRHKLGAAARKGWVTRRAKRGGS